MVFLKKIAFSLTVITFKIRDIFTSPGSVVKESGIKEGQTILDYGCGPGNYSIVAAKLVGNKGRVYAADADADVISYIRRITKSNLNIEAIQTDCDTDLLDKSIDIVLLFDVYHCLEQPERIIKELHRVLKDEGILSFSDHHMKDEEILKEISKHGLFRLFWKGNKTYNFVKTN